MSFILDALRKSESERQQAAPPSIARIPSAVPQHGLPTWAIATMGALGVGVVALAVAWIATLTGTPRGPAAAGNVTAAQASPSSFDAGLGGTAAATGPSRVEPLPLPPPRTASPGRTDAGGSVASGDAAAFSAERSAFAADASQGVSRSSPLAEAVNRPSPVTASPLAMAARSQTSAQTSTSRSPQQTARRAADLPAVDPMPEPYHAVAPSLGLPELTLQLLAYDENDPSQQFAFINGARYMAGDTLPGDIRVIAINRRGAVLLARGRQLQLETR